jgi:hypothetical protein
MLLNLKTQMKCFALFMIAPILLSVWMVFPSPASAELVLHLAFEGDLLDSSGYDNDASIVPGSGTITISEPGVFGNALSIKGGSIWSPSYLRVEDSSSISPTGAITLSAWVKPAGQIGSNAGIFFKGPWAYQPDYQLHINDVGTGPSLGPSGACATINGNGYASSEAFVIDYDVLQPVPDGLWTHVAATYDGDVLRLYVNGTQVDEYLHTDVIEQSGTPLFIGNRFAPYGDVGLFQGLMDDLKIFDTALTADEICALFCAGVATGNVIYDVGCTCNQAPLAVCQDVTVMAGSYCEGIVEPADVDNGSYDPDGDPITLSLSPEGPYQMGTTVVTFTVTDDQGASSTCMATVTVLGAGEGILHLVAEVMALNLQNGIENSLDVKLDAALQALDDINANNNVAAAKAIDAFINAVFAQRDDKIPEADADGLIDTANKILVGLQNGCY